jgi:hypothetical protein
MSTAIPLPLAGKSALVTGEARSVGAGIALTLCPFLIESGFSAQLNLVSAQQGEALTLVQFYSALGGGWQ